MRFRYNESCSVCNKIFCCSKCRDKHVRKKHHYRKLKGKAILATNILPENLECPICVQQPLPLRRVIDAHLLEHIANKHLPLHCQKCDKIYKCTADLKDFNVCNSSQTTCNLTTEHISHIPVVTTGSKNNISTQTSPIVALNLDLYTPNSLTAHPWKSIQKVIKEDYISDSVSSIKNLSAFSNSSIRRSLGIVSSTTAATKGKLVRTTSTPVQAELLPIKPKEQTFNSSGVQVSSIYNSECEPLPVATHTNNTFASPPKQTMENVYKYRKKNILPRVAAVTPLRQVMSKSIQKAFAEHGALPSGRVLVNERKKILKSFDSDSGSHIVNSMNSPLDLRISPVARRASQFKANEECIDAKPINMKIESKASTEQPHHSKLLTTESIVITRTRHVSSSTQNTYAQLQSAQDLNAGNGSVVTTCQSVEIITSTEVNAFKSSRKATTKTLDTGNFLGHDETPISREQGPIIQKKIINFETPKKPTIKIEHNVEKDLLAPNRNNKCAEISVIEKFYTPDATLMSQSSLSVTTEDNDAQDRKKYLVRRKLSHNFSPKKRPPLRYCRGSNIFKRVECDDTDEDEVFLKPTSSKQELQKKNEATSGWSFGNFIHSVKQRLCSDIEIKNINKLPILKRCASFAGYLVRTNSLSGSEDMKIAKRKRTSTISEQHNNFITEVSHTISSPENISNSKRLRIQRRKPIRLSPI